jgi:hypothetical protein
MPAGHLADGEDVGDIWLGQTRGRRKPLYWEWRFNIAGHVWNRSPQLAIRDGDWKLLMNPDRSRIELYDIPRDRMQAENLAARNPEIVARLSGQLAAWQEQLPDGPRDRAAGLIDYRWPGSGGDTSSNASPGGGKRKGRKVN